MTLKWDRSVLHRDEQSAQALPVPETGYAAEAIAAHIADQTHKPSECGTTGRHECPLYRAALVEASSFVAVANRWQQYATEWSRENATLRAEVARLTAENAALKAKLDVTTDDFGCVPMSFSSVIDGIDSRQTQEAVENLVVWHMRRAEQADAERDAARAQVWAEAVAVVEQMEPVPAVTFSMARAAVLAAIRAAQGRTK